MMQYYIYRHVRVDTGQPFYIGASKKKPDKYIEGFRSEYSRAFTSMMRSKKWHAIKSITGIDVEIIYECETEKEAHSKEKEFIALYGRQDIGTGILINQTDGGWGRKNAHPNTMINNGKNLNSYHEANKKKVYQYSMSGVFIKEYSSITEATKELNDNTTSGIVQVCQGKCRYYKNYIWRYTKDDNVSLGIRGTNAKRLGMYDRKTNKLLKSFNSAREAAKYINGSYKAISLCANGKTKTSSGYIWKFI